MATLSGKPSYTTPWDTTLSGLDRTYISHLERGLANPSLLKMSQLARIVGKSVADLLRG